MLKRFKITFGEVIMYYIYKSCIGDPVITEYELGADDLICDVCGQSATFISVAESSKEVADIINSSNFKFSYTAKEEIESMFSGLKYDSKCGIMLN